MSASAVLYVGNLDLMRDFYAGCFDLTVADDTNSYCRLQSEVWELMLVWSAEAVPASSPPPRRASTPVKLAFEVSSIEAARVVAARFGGVADSDDAEWQFQKSLRCDCTDPEGNVVQLVQRRHST